MAVLHRIVALWAKPGASGRSIRPGSSPGRPNRPGTSPGRPNRPGTSPGRPNRPATAPRVSEPIWRRAAALGHKLRLTLRPDPRSSAGLDPTLPATAQLVAVQQPSVALPERPYDLLLLVAVLGLLGIGTIEIYSATAADGLTRFHDSGYFLERQIGFLVIGGFATWIGARIDYRRL